MNNMYTHLELIEFNEHRRLQEAESAREFKVLIEELEFGPRTSHGAEAVIKKIHSALFKSSNLVVESRPTVYHLLRKYSRDMRRLRIAEEQEVRTEALRLTERVAALRIHPNAWRHILSFGPQ